MKHHHLLTLLKVLATHTKERNSPKEAESLLEVNDMVRDYLTSTKSQPAEKSDD